MTSGAAGGERPAAAVLRLLRHLLAMGRGRVARAFALAAIAALLEGVAVVALPTLLRLLGGGGDEMEPGTASLLAAAFGYVVLAAAVAAVSCARSTSVHTLSLELLDRLRGDLHSAILAMEWMRFRRMRAAELQQVVVGEVGRISHAVILLGNLAGAVLSMGFVLTASLALSWPLTLGALAVTGLVIVMTRRLGARGFLLGRELGAINRDAQAGLADDLAGLRIIKGFGAEAVRQAGMARRFAAARRNQVAYQRSRATELALLQLVAAAAAAVTLYVAVKVLRVSLAEALVLILAYARLLQAAFRALGNWRQLTGAVGALAGYEGTLALCRSAAEQVAAVAPALPVPRAAIRLVGVSVRHDDAGIGRAVLDGIDAVLPARRITAVVGPSGAGKSTLADVVSGLIAPEDGGMFIDDVPLPPEARGAWRRRVAVVPQDPFLFHDTIAANLRMARPDADVATLWQALEEAAAADFVRRLPEGLETVVGDRGARLSGGERQRIVLARALLRRPDLLVLDEATASLDGETEAAVATTLAALRDRCTVLVVAHRPSTVRAADHVLFLESGRLVAAGSWTDIRAHAGARLAALGLADS
jgi:ATP-binding cassette subfamily C protein